MKNSKIRKNSGAQENVHVFLICFKSSCRLLLVVVLLDLCVSSRKVCGNFGGKEIVWYKGYAEHIFTLLYSYLFCTCFPFTDKKNCLLNLLKIFDKSKFICWLNLDANPILLIIIMLLNKKLCLSFKFNVHDHGNMLRGIYYIKLDRLQSICNYDICHLCLFIYLDDLNKIALFVELSATWKAHLVSTGATSKISHLIFSVILFSNIKIAYILLSCYMLHALLWFLTHCKIHKCNIRMGETWRLTRSYPVDVMNLYCPTAGDMVVLATVCYSLLSFLFRLSGPTLLSAVKELFNAVTLGMHRIHSPD